jgi:hypothetical protein
VNDRRINDQLNDLTAVDSYPAVTVASAITVHPDENIASLSLNSDDDAEPEFDFIRSVAE